MRTIGNIIWILCGGILTAIFWALAGILFYITIVGIPLGRQAFKMANLTLAPFGKTIIYGGGAPSLLANIVWVIVIGFWEAIAFSRWRSFRSCPSVRVCSTPCNGLRLL